MNEKKSIFKTGQFWMIITALGYAAGNIFDKVAMSTYGTDSYLAALMKAVPQFVVPIILLFMGVDKKQFGVKTTKPPKKAFLYFVFCGFISSFIGQYFFLRAMAVGGVNVAVPVVNIWTMVGAILGIVILKEAFHKNIVIGAGLAFLGILVLSFGQYQGMPVSDQWYMGVVYALITAFCWAFSTLSYNKGQQMGVDRTVGMFTQYFSGSIIVVIFMACTGRLGSFAATSPAIYATLLGSGLFSTVATFSLYTAVRYAPMSKILPINISYPALCAVVAWLFLGESMNIWIALGIVMVILGVILSQVTKAKMGEEARKAAAAAAQEQK